MALCKHGAAQCRSMVMVCASQAIPYLIACNCEVAFSDVLHLLT